MTIREATEQEIAQWNELLAHNPDGGNVFASHELAETKRLNGWKPHYLLADNLAITGLEKHVPLCGKFWYLPKGPGLTSVEAINNLLPDLQQFARTKGVFAIKLEPEIIETDETLAALSRLGVVRTNPVQPNVSTVLIDTAPELDDILASFNQKGRHALRRAERDGVTVYPAEVNEPNMQQMYQLLAATAAGRFDASLRSYDYYRNFWKSFAENETGSLFFAEFEGRIVASAFCMYLGKKGTYKDGASERDKSTYGASQLLQWEVIKWMKERGVTSYDLCGTPHSSRINDTTHPHYGMGRFKTSLNKHVTDYVGCWDVVVNPRAYRLWQRIMQRVVISASWRLKHRQWL